MILVIDHLQVQRALLLMIKAWCTTLAKMLSTKKESSGDQYDFKCKARIDGTKVLLC